MAVPPLLLTALAAVVIFIALDLLWLAIIARRLYFKYFSYLAKIKNGGIVFNLYAGIAAQAVISCALTGVIVLALHAANTMIVSVAAGAAAGFALYATYDLTNLSFIRDYSVTISAVDIAWGTFQGAFAGVYVFYFIRLFS